ncbi:MAG TPA: PEGA domain-containing protein, partial [Kofleriaceae bacterium]
TERPPEDDAATQARDFAADHPTNPLRVNELAPPAALAAKIHVPAVSEIRKPRPSRRTPPGGGVKQPPNVLHAIVSSQASEPMPAPRPSLRPPSSQLPLAQQPPSGSIAQSPALPMPMMAPMPMGQPQQAAPMAPMPMTQSQPLSMASTQPMPPIGPAQGLAPPVASPMAVTMPESLHAPGDPFAPQFSLENRSSMGTSGGMAPGFGAPPGGPQNPAGVPPYLVYPPMQVAPPGYPQQPLAAQMSPHGYPQLLPGALYPFQTPPQELSLTGQMRAAEIDELPSHYRLGAARARWFTYIVSGVLAVSVAAAVTFLIIRSMRDSAPQVGSVYINSVPAGADVLFEGTRLRDKTPLTIDKVPVGTHPTIRIELAHYGPHEEVLEIPRSGAEISVMAHLKAITGKIIIDSVPPGAEIHINGRMRGRTPTTISDVDMDSAKVLELRLKDYQLLVQDLVWPADGRIQINAKLVR